MQAQVEREDKYKVKTRWVLPDLSGLAPAGATLSTDTRTLESTYFDTTDGALRQFGVTLRRRVGGGEDGWQLKVPAGAARTELHSTSADSTMPDEISEAVRGFAVRDGLVPVATVTTSRTAHRAIDSDGELVFELADDSVSSTTLGTEATLRSWREVEVELGPAGQEQVLAKARKLLRLAGARLAGSGTKLHHALGVAAHPSSGDVSIKSVGDLVHRYLAEQCEVLAVNDIGLRTGAPIVHKTRVAVRRTRSTLRIFAALFDPEAAAAFDEELSWYADLLGAVRDGEVLERRLTTRLELLPAEHILGPVVADIHKALALDLKEAKDRLFDGMTSARYADLFATVRRWREAPPLTRAGSAKAKDATRYVAAAGRKATKRLKGANGDVEQLHRARKATKRHRYAAELVQPIDPTQARIAKKAEQRQADLGEHQDAIVAAEYLRDLGARTGARSGHNGYTYGYLVALELAQAATIRAKLKS